MARCVLAYSGGLDTSVILSWLKDEGYEVHAVYVDLGQPCEDRGAIMQKAETIGAASARLIDAQEELCRDFAFPIMQWQAKYEGMYLLGTSIARPLISKVCSPRPARSERRPMCTGRQARATTNAASSWRPRPSTRRSRWSLLGGMKPFESSFPAEAR